MQSALDEKMSASPSAAPGKQELIAALTAAGQQPQTLVGERGETIVILPHGGRVLGVFAPGSERNLLWTAPTLSAEKTAREHFASDKWCNSGGDRTWLAAEVDFFYPEYPDTTRYFQPRQLDPGRYVATRTSAGVTLENSLTLQSYRGGWTAGLRITKTVSAVLDPLIQEATATLGGEVEFAGYRLHTVLELLDANDDRCRVGLWNLLQLPGGGDMLIPVHRRSTPVVYFGDVPKGDLRVEEQLIRYRMSASGEQKIGVDAVALTGRTGYVVGEGDQTTLVIRSFSVDPGGVYVDVPLHDRGSPGHAFQACNINTDYLGVFAELEYHAPAIGGAGGSRRSDDVSQVWAFRGEREAVRQVAMQLLGVQLCRPDI